MRDPVPASGLTALPLPWGDPAGLWRAAGWLRVAATHVADAPLAAGGMPTIVTDGWSGVAAEEAGSDAAVLGSRAALLADRLVRAAVVIAAYGDALDTAQRVTLGLQTAYDAGSHPPVPPAGLGGDVTTADPTTLADPTGLAVLAVLAGRYAVAVADLDLAGGVAAHRLRGLAAEVGDGPVGRGGQRSGSSWGGGTADPDPRAAAMAGLALVAAAIHRAEADRDADAVVDALSAVTADDPWAVDAAATLVARWAADPVFARSLWSRLSPDALADVLTAVAAPQPAGGRPSAVSADWRGERGGALVQALGVALVVAANPAYQAGLHRVTAAGLDEWRTAWLERSAASADQVVRRSDGTTVGGAWVQGQLLAAAAAAGLTPGAHYAVTVGVAIVAADKRGGRADGGATGLTPSATAFLTPDGRSLAVPGLTGDPVLALTQALTADATAARAWLLHPLPGAPDRMVVDHLVDTRYLELAPAAGAAAMSALGRLVLVAGSDPASRDATLVAAAHLDAVGRTALDSPHPATFRRALGPALGDIGTLLGAHPDAVTATLDDSAAPGSDAHTLTPADRLVRAGRDPGSWEVVLADRTTAAALVGELARDGRDAPAAGDPASAPALTQAMGGIATTLEADLVAAIAARPPGGGGAEAVEAAARRLGSTTGFVLSSAGAALALQGADLDAEHRRLADLADGTVGKVIIPGAAGRLATPVVRAAADLVVARALPTAAEAAQRDATTAALAQRRDDALTAVRTLVSRAHPWGLEQSPARWAARTAATRAPVPFWDAAGVPLPEPEMTTAQRRSFTDWRRDEGLAVYDTVPQVVRDGLEAGVRDAAATPAPERRP